MVDTVSMSPAVRRLLIASGCYLTATALILSWPPMDPFSPISLLIGALIHGRSPKPGIWLLWLSAFSMSIWSFDLIGLSFREFLFPGFITIPYLAIIAAEALIVLCDIALVVDAIQFTGREQCPASSRSLDWVAWICALILSLFYGYVAYGAFIMLNSHSPSRHVTSITAGAIAITVLLLDAALIVRALKGATKAK